MTRIEITIYAYNNIFGERNIKQVENRKVASKFIAAGYFEKMHQKLFKNESDDAHICNI